MKHFSELINTSLINEGHHIGEQTAVLIPNIMKAYAKSVFGVWIDFVFVNHADILESWVRKQESLCCDAEPEQNRSQCGVQSSRIQ
jgi:hypothetical protein